MPLAKIQNILNIMALKSEVIGFPPIRLPLASLDFHTSTVSLAFLVVSTLILGYVGKAVTWQSQEVFQI